jgi:hypothetical protein
MLNEMVGMQWHDVAWLEADGDWDNGMSMWL